jgi:hypothetical protein
MPGFLILICPNFRLSKNNDYGFVPSGFVVPIDAGAFYC